MVGSSFRCAPGGCALAAAAFGIWLRPAAQSIGDPDRAQPYGSKLLLYLRACNSNLAWCYHFGTLNNLRHTTTTTCTTTTTTTTNPVAAAAGALAQSRAANGDLEMEGERATAREAEKKIEFSVLECTRKTICNVRGLFQYSRKSRKYFPYLP